MHGKRLSQLTWLGLALFAASACNGPAADDAQAALGGPVDTIGAQRDSLFAEVADNARLLNEIGEELNKVEGLSAPDSGTVESPASATRERLLHQVREVTSRLADTEKRLAQSRRQIRAASKASDSLTGRVTELEKMVADFEAVLESQRTTVAALTDRVSALETENLALRDTITTMETEENTAYYVVGTKDELIQRGIITKEGGSRVLFIFGRRGETLVPARNIDTSQFTAIDIRQVTEIPLPDSAAEYLIASRQNLGALQTAAAAMSAEVRAYQESRLNEAPEPKPVTEPDKQKQKGRVQGTIRIAEPEQFWLPSKFLIVVRS
jgi:polyhydroxyalkanoate synthesis regulator phasin